MIQQNLGDQSGGLVTEILNRRLTENFEPRRSFELEARRNFEAPPKFWTEGPAKLQGVSTRIFNIR